MPIVISLIRGINVGGHKKIKMADLRDLFSSLGMRQVRTLLQSGNAIFDTDETDLALLKQQLEAGIREHFGFDAQVLLRTPAAFKAAIDRHPFDEQQPQEPGKAAIVFLSDVPARSVVDELRASNPGREVIHANGCELFVFYIDGMARSKLDTKRIKRALNLVGSARNWNTCQRLLKLLEEVEAQANCST